jgi:parvulin-like peptidyl-prolyl isomerase
VVATVNGQPIALEAFQRELARFEAGQAALGLEPSQQPGYQQQVLNTLIEQELFRQFAAQQGIVISDEQVDAEINDMIAETGQEFFDGWLAGNSYTLDEFREFVRTDLITQQLISPVLDSVPQSVEHVHARHILVNSLTEAQEALDRLNSGEDFASLAAEYSVDVTTRDSGGDLGWFPRGLLLVQEVEETAFSLQPGQRSDIVQSDWGYHIIETLEFNASMTVDPDAYQRLREQAIEDWRLSLRQGADIQQLVSLPL